MRYAISAVVILLAILAKNLVWLGTSTIRIQNKSGMTVDAVAYSACEKTHTVGTLRPDQSAFRFLEACGDDTLEIIVGDSDYCRIYVEGELYHVDAAIDNSASVSCTYDDLLSSLFVEKMLRWRPAQSANSLDPGFLR